jgi:small subunit ribosomal protein S19
MVRFGHREASSLRNLYHVLKIVFHRNFCQKGIKTFLGLKSNDRQLKYQYVERSGAKQRLTSRIAMRGCMATLARSVWKGPFADALVAVPGAGGGTVRGTRRSMVLPDWVGRRIDVHNGRRWIPVSVEEDMIGHRLGEFAATRSKSAHKAVLLKQRQAQKGKKKKA